MSLLTQFLHLGLTGQTRQLPAVLGPQPHPRLKTPKSRNPSRSSRLAASGLFFTRRPSSATMPALVAASPSPPPPAHDREAAGGQRSAGGAFPSGSWQRRASPNSPYPRSHRAKNSRRPQVPLITWSLPERCRRYPLASSLPNTNPASLTLRLLTPLIQRCNKAPPIGSLLDSIGQPALSLNFSLS